MGKREVLGGLVIGGIGVFGAVECNSQGDASAKEITDRRSPDDKHVPGIVGVERSDDLLRVVYYEKKEKTVDHTVSDADIAALEEAIAEDGKNARRQENCLDVDAKGNTAWTLHPELCEKVVEEICADEKDLEDCIGNIYLQQDSAKKRHESILSDQLLPVDREAEKKLGAYFLIHLSEEDSLSYRLSMKGITPFQEIGVLKKATALDATYAFSFVEDWIERAVREYREDGIVSAEVQQYFDDADIPWFRLKSQDAGDGVALVQ